MKIRYNSYRAYLRTRFGNAIRTIPVHIGCTCPNRDGTLSSEGCAFCDNRAFSPVAASQASPVDQVLAAQKRWTTRHTLFLPYLQAFSNTYGDIDELAKTYGSLLALPGVIGLAIGTRPDCISDEMAEYLQHLTRRYYISVELGVQSMHAATLAHVRRGHGPRATIRAVELLAARGISTVAHLMFGLPEDTDETMLKGVEMVGALPFSGVKFHQLMIIRHTLCAEEYLRGRLQPLSLRHYGTLLCRALPLLSPSQLVHRLMADSRPEFGLIAPSFSARKNESLRLLQQMLEREDVRQGSRWRRQ